MPLGYLTFHLFPFLPILWKAHRRALTVPFSNPVVFQGKTILVARRR